ncbi:MAG TPA: UDP-glucose 4-epimerase GalE [Caulobacteraceae bacterium]|nr:UDP-glucose 4-epimerase GalE [Caulobacteraceae bacterium]
MTTTVLVTGGAGYIGSHACKALAAAGLTPVVYDNLSRGFEWAVKWGPFERGDLLDQARLEVVIRRHQPIAVMHFAAFAYVGESVAYPATYYRNNVVGSLALLEAMRAGGVDRIVFSSSCTTYGVRGAEPIGEDTPQAPVNPYGVTKLLVEQALRDYAVAYGLRAVAMRYFNAAGADPDGEIGEAHDPETHLIPLVLEAAATAAPLTVFGDDYPTPDGTCIRDYVHVTDLADAHVAALQSLDHASGFRAFNLGTGRGLSNLEIIAAARRVTGREIPIRIGPRRAGDPPVLTADASRAGRELGWTPRLSSLDDIIDTAWRWRQRGQPAPPLEGAAS